MDEAIQSTQGQMLLLQTTMGKLDSEVNEMVISHQASTQSVQSLSTQVDKWTVEVSTSLSTLEKKVDRLSGLLDDLPTQFTEMEQTGGGAQEEKREIVGGKRVNTQRRKTREIGQRILDAIQRLGVQASDRQIARDVHCSPTTVARWKQRFSEH
jgi:chromosome segregation ATPase